MFYVEQKGIVMKMIWTLIVTSIFGILIMLGGCQHKKLPEQSFGNMNGQKVYFVGLGSQ